MRYLSVIFLAGLSFISYAQQTVEMNCSKPEDAAIFLRTENGETSIVNSLGTTVKAHPVFQTSIDERIQRGWAHRVQPDEIASSGRSSAIGPVFNITYLDVVNDSKEGFDDPDLGQMRRTALENAFLYFSNSIDNSGEVDIEIRESFFGSPTTNPFAYSASYYFGAAGFNRSFTQQHIITGNDPYPDFPDGYIQFNFADAMNYHFSSNSYPADDQFDFHTIAIHEIMHLLGFTSYLSNDGNSAASPGVFTEFDMLLRDIDNQELITVTGSGQNTSVTGPVASMLTNGQLWSELQSGGYAPVYSPQYFTGSSCSHLDNDRGGHNYVMHPSLSRGDAFKVLDEDEVDILQGLGYQIDIGVATGTQEPAFPLANSGNLYPNPATNEQAVTIEVDGHFGEEILVIVFDMLGRESYSKVVVQRGQGPITAIDPYNNIPAGMYIVVGSSNDELFNKRLVIK